MASRTITLALVAVSVLALSCAALAGDIYVDAAATGAGNGSSWADAFTTIQAGIDAASAGDVVHVNAGTYPENIDFKGKAITVTSTDPLDPAVVAATVIDGGSVGSVVTFNLQESSSSILAGFTLQRFVIRFFSRLVRRRRVEKRRRFDSKNRLKGRRFGR